MAADSKAQAPSLQSKLMRARMPPAPDCLGSSSGAGMVACCRLRPTGVRSASRAKAADRVASNRAAPGTMGRVLTCTGSAGQLLACSCSKLQATSLSYVNLPCHA